MALHQSSKPKARQELLRETNSQLPLTRTNFILMAIAGVMIILGFCLMAGGATGMDSFNPDIFSARRIVVGPTISFLGFIFMGFAIMYNPKGRQGSNAEEGKE